MKNYSTMNTMQCFSSQNSLSNSSKDSKQMFLTTRRGEPLIPTSNYLQNHHLQNQSILNQQQQQNYPCVHPHHTVLSSSCSPSISSNSINVWTTINNSTGVKQSIDKVPQYSALTTLGRLNTLHNTNLHNNSLLNSNLVHNKQNNHRKDTFRWRSNEKGFCFLLLIIGCILTFILLIFSLIFYFIVFKQGVTFNSTNQTISTPLTTSNLINNNKFNPNLKPDFIDKFKQPTSNEQPKVKRKRLINKIDGELRIMNKQFKLRDYDNEIQSLKQVLSNFIQRNLNLCLNNTEINQYRRGDNHNLNGVIVNFILTFDCALPNLPKRLAFALRDSFKSDYQIDFRTLRLTPVFDQNSKIEYVDVLESETDNWLKFTKNSEWGKWTDWSQCDCKNGIVVKSRQRTCLNKTTNKSAFSFSCGNNDDNDEHLPSVEIRNCGCEQIFDTQFDNKNNRNNGLSSTTSSINSQSIHNNLDQVELAICSRCEKTNEICLSYNSQMPNCLKILNFDDKCGGHCNSKGTECKYVKEKHLHQCIHTNETTDGNVCLDDEFKCLDGLCIPNIKYCNGEPNCFDASDEINCQCDIESGEYMHCNSNSTSCIHISKRCDQVEDCALGEDELNCFTNCPSGDDLNSNQVFHCLSGNKECIPIDKFCNDFRDCWDGSDEIDCIKSSSSNKLTNHQHRNRFNITN